MYKHKSARENVSVKRRRRTPNYLPQHICRTFESQLNSLIADLPTTEGFKGAYLLSEYKSKYLDSSLYTPDDRRSAAIQKWIKAESKNHITNQRLFLGDADFGWATSDQLIAFAKKKISETLGPLHYPAILMTGSHSSGASTRTKRQTGGMILKYTGEAHVSSSAVKHWLQYATNSMAADQELTIVESSVLFTVPKKTEIDRVACKEPEINMFLQKAAGNHIRRSLRRCGIDLNDQTINKRLAHSASLSRDLSTIDLSAASDSITELLVMKLLPSEWFDLLDDLRVKTVDVEGSIHEVNMFSSMGNGFTFELESLIFWALAHAIKFYSKVKGIVSVYGDDIVVPTVIARRLARTYEWFGFRVNQDKSSWTGSFRESCGGHYDNGRDVTPFYLKEPVRRMTCVIRLLNRLADWDSRGVGFITNPAILEFHRKWSETIPQELWGGISFDDISALVTGDRPRSRLIVRPGKRLAMIGKAELARNKCWFVLRGLSGDNPIELIPKAEGNYIVAPQPKEVKHLTDDPWFLTKIASSVNCVA